MYRIKKITIAKSDIGSQESHTSVDTLNQALILHVSVAAFFLALLELDFKM